MLRATTNSNRSSTLSLTPHLARAPRREPIDALVVDDESPLRELVRSYLELEGFVVQTAADGLQALEKLQRYEPRFVLVDLNMPRMDGIEFVRRLQLRPEGRTIAPLFVTSETSLAPQNHGLGNIPVLAKPFNFSDLLDTILSLEDHNLSCVVS